MEQREIKNWNRKVKFFESAENEMLESSKGQIQPVSFYEGVAILIAKAYLQSEPHEEPDYGYTAQQAA